MPEAESLLPKSDTQGAPAADTAPENKSTIDQDIEKRAAEKKIQLEQLELSVREETERLRSLREERRRLSSTDDDIDTQDDTQRPAVIDDAWKLFKKAHPEYEASNDPGNERWGALNSHFQRVRFNEGDIHDTFDALEYAHKQLQKELKMSQDLQKTTEVLGSLESQPAKAPSKQGSALERKLNAYERSAASVFPGGEAAYRKALAESEAKHEKRRADMY